MNNRYFQRLLKNFGLQRQLMIITLSTIILSFASLAIVLPNLLTPFYEENLFTTLNQSLHFVQSDFNLSESDTIIILQDKNRYLISDNFSSTFRTDDVEIIASMLKSSSGKFSYNTKNYYYVKYSEVDAFKAALQDDSYITNQKSRLSLIIIPTLGLTLLIVVTTLILYSNYLVRKISIINQKIKNMNNKNYNHDVVFELDDELNSLIKSIEKMRMEIMNQEEYKSNMFQSLSHDLKTPITVINSYIEAAKEKVVTDKKSLSVIKEEIDILNKKVALILQLNKVNYLIDNKREITDIIDLTPLVSCIVEKYKIIKPNVEFEIKLSKAKYKGSEDLWNQIFDNILNNFIRYVDKKIIISVGKKQIKLYNDGPNIEKEIIDGIFQEYKIGKKGKYGLGLSIVRKTVELLGYRIRIVNEKDSGVSFIIE